MLTVNRNKEIFRLDIFLFELGLVGLGVSVKGKIMIIDRGTRDLGIFVKFVIYGGVVSKVGYIIIFLYILYN